MDPVRIRIRIRIRDNDLTIFSTKIPLSKKKITMYRSRIREAKMKKTFMTVPVVRYWYGFY
jgi:hypothetical protein